MFLLIYKFCNNKTELGYVPIYEIFRFMFGCIGLVFLFRFYIFIKLFCKSFMKYIVVFYTKFWLKQFLMS